MNEYKNNTYIYTELKYRIFIKLPLLNTDSAFPSLIIIIGKMQSNRQTYISHGQQSAKEMRKPDQRYGSRLESDPATLMSGRSSGTNDEETE